MLNTALLERQTELQEKSAQTLARMAGVDFGFDLNGYRDYLRKKCGKVQLAAMHASTYDRRINLWNISFPNQPANQCRFGIFLASFSDASAGKDISHGNRMTSNRTNARSLSGQSGKRRYRYSRA